ncbi:UPF0147 family protein [Candidatus Woesearchaeota archaeon]|nr:UPF0147 family protein [Candidatus Woesearchaeota archaeon]
MDALIQVVELLAQIEQDMSVPKNIRSKVKSAASLLQIEQDMAIKIDKSLQELDEIAEDTNTPSYTRTQIWNIVSLLEARKV